MSTPLTRCVHPSVSPQFETLMQTITRNFSSELCPGSLYGCSCVCFRDVSLVMSDEYGQSYVRN